MHAPRSLQMQDINSRHVYRAAYIRRDERGLLKLVQPGQPDLIAKWTCYHWSFYMKYTHQKSLQGIFEANVWEEGGEDRGMDYAKAAFCDWLKKFREPF